jgi:excisionase family DNA binding protein
VDAPPDPRLPPGECPYVTTAQVGQALGVSVTTVKRWVDDGILPAHRTAGGHRKLLVADVVRLARAGNLPQADLSRLIPLRAAALTDPAALYDQFRAAVVGADAAMIRSVLYAGYRAGTPVETLADRVIAPALAALGHDWEAGRAGVATEHRVTQACVSALYELRGQLRAETRKGRPVAVGGAPEHDHTVLPSLLAKLTLLDAGWEAVNLGPHTPLEAFATAIDEFSPRLLWLSVSHLHDPPTFLADYRKLYALCEARSVAVAVGGSGLQPTVRASMTYTAFGDGMTQLLAFARSLHREAGIPKRGRPAGS